MDAAQCISIPDQVSKLSDLSKLPLQVFDGGTIDLERLDMLKLLGKPCNLFVHFRRDLRRVAYATGDRSDGGRCLARHKRQFQIECVGDGGQARDGEIDRAALDLGDVRLRHACTGTQRALAKPFILARSLQCRR